MQTWTDEALRALLCEELEAASYPVRRKQLIERSAARLGERVRSPRSVSVFSPRFP